MIYPIAYAASVGVIPFADFFFFFPQLAFPYYSIVTRNAYGSTGVFTDTSATLLSVLQWGLVTVLFSFSARRLKMGYMILSALAVLLVVTYIVIAGFGLFGMTTELDGP